MSKTESIDPETIALAKRLTEQITASWESQALYVAAKLRLPDHLSAGPKSSVELAAITNSHPASLRQLLQALTTINICEELDGDSFRLTATGALLRSDAPASLRSWSLWWGEYLWPVWGNLLYSVRTGQSARKLLNGSDGFSHLENDPEAAATFYQVTINLTRLTAQVVVPHYDFSGIKRLVDVGGGYGEFLMAILRGYPSIAGVLFDLAIAIEGAKRHYSQAGLDGRCEFVAGDFFESVPAGADAYLLKSVIHDWDDDRSAKILATCRRNMSDEARLLVVEQILPERRERSTKDQNLSRHDLTMLVACGAHERTESEYRTLLTSAGFRIARIIPAGPTFSIVEAFPDR